MKHFGAILEPEEEKPLEEFLKSMRKWGSTEVKKTTYQDQAQTFSLENPKVKEKISEGKSIYFDSCSACHGALGEGKMGPRLRGRLIPRSLFFEAVLKGKNSMPAFELSLKKEQVESLWQFLQRADHTTGG